MIRTFSTAALIWLMAGSAQAIPTYDPAQVAEHQAIADAMTAAEAELMKPGPKQDGWDKGGVDIFALIEAAPGGVAENYLLEVDKDGERSLTFVRAREIGRIVPEDWKALLHAGSSREPSSSDSLTISSLDGPFYFTAWENLRRVGDAFCSGGNMGGYLYEVPGSTAESEMPPELIPAIFNAAVRRFENLSICWRYDLDGETFRVRHYLEDGRTLPTMDELGGTVSIVRGRPIDQLRGQPR